MGNASHPDYILRPQERDFEHAASTLKLLGSSTRLAILHLLAGHELSVSAVAEELQRPLPAVSQHLAKLKAVGLVASRRDGTTIYYSQPDEHVAALVRNALEFAEHRLYSTPPHHSTEDSASR
ncbi:ArsR/SmtB family transcription factor [Timonella senegalensis]|uniref:ArsR/SmtB family transcription factor n=1 Tax=Timonella senegalensis TaxID=1465825 RepID=UPI0002D552F9|nr:metalloregulator ArsR/SmtB family transcription factor [Timonella senegalensis]